jgi:hypothetical protein
MKDMMKMLKQAKDMQKNMQIMQDKLAETEVTGSAGGQAVEVVMTCTQEVKSVKIKPEAVDPNDVETLEDLVQAAMADALRRAQDVTQAEMQAVTGGLSLPGM